MTTTPTASRRSLWTARIVVGVLTLALLALLGRTYQLQARPEPRIAALMDGQRSVAEITGRRGAITDRRGRALAQTRTARRLFVDPVLIDDRNTFSERVGYSLGLDPVQIEMSLSQRSGSRYVVIDRQADEERERRLAGVDLPGLASESITVREYPQGPLAGQVVGFVGAEGRGLDGLERAWERRLQPEAGEYAFLRDARRRAMWLDGGYRAPADGQTIRLSIDLTIQAIAERRLAEAVEEFGAQAGQMVVMQPWTGEVLAMANYPAFDPSRFGSQDAKLRRNRCVTDVFEPGSIFKPFVWAAAVDAGAARPEEKIDTSTAGWWKPTRGPVLRDAHPHGLLSWDQVLILSSNIGMGRVAQDRLGREKLHAMIRDFGFGESTGSGLPGEMSGLLRSVKDWSATDVTRMPMGQGIAVTPMQIVRAFCVFANDGLLVQPRIEAVDPTDLSSASTASAVRRVLSPALARHTRNVLGRVVTEGTGRRAESKLYDVFGKTGTAQLPDLERGGYYADQYVSSFVGGAPLENPQLVVGCFIHRPDRDKGHFGGTVAGPAVRDVLEASLQYLGVPPRAEE